MKAAHEFIILLLALMQVALCNILVKTCQPTDFKGILSSQEIFSMTIAAEFGNKATTYLVGGHAQQSIRR